MDGTMTHLMDQDMTEMPELLKDISLKGCTSLLMSVSGSRQDPHCHSNHRPGVHWPKYYPANDAAHRISVCFMLCTTVTLVT